MVASVRKDSPAGAVPRHVAVIMDGNGRWARQRALPRQAGHRAGIEPVRAVVEHCASQCVEYLTLFAFSSENWKRPQVEIHGLMALFVDTLNTEVAELNENGIRLASWARSTDSVPPFRLPSGRPRPAPATTPG